MHFQWLFLAAVVSTGTALPVACGSGGLCSRDISSPTVHDLLSISPAVSSASDASFNDVVPIIDPIAKREANPLTIGRPQEAVSPFINVKIGAKNPKTLTVHSTRLRNGLDSAKARLADWKSAQYAKQLGKQEQRNPTGGNTGSGGATVQA